LTDGHVGYAPGAPYSTIHVGASSPFIPPALVEQLAPGGVMVLPLGPHEKQTMTLVRKGGGGVEVVALDTSIRYLPLKPQKVEWGERYKKKWCYGKEANRFLREHAVPGNGRALVPGCGYGRNALHLSKLGWDVTGVDVCGVGLEKAALLYRGAGGLEAKFVKGDFMELAAGLEPGGFACIAVIYAPVSPVREYVRAKRARRRA
jgi:protein-L-isoaspartate O-methyltransferase